MINYAVDPEILKSRVPIGTELDFHDGQTFVSVVGFRFLDTRLFGLPIPLHRDFEEVNLRFYVRRKSGDDWRRGVAFVRELVPRPAIAIVARAFYGEPYLTVPMRHVIEHKEGRIHAEYQWRRKRRWETLLVTGIGEPRSSQHGSHEEFITEHYWGYTGLQSGLSEYRVEHDRWKLWSGETAKFEADVATLYGPEFVEALGAKPVSAFIADGSHVEVLRRTREFV
jgi:uncharacterized protein YqjF (DUF2071 family)